MSGVITQFKPSNPLLPMYLPIPPIDQAQKHHHQDTRRRFDRARASLSDWEQTLFYLRYYQELPVKELAVRYGLTTRALSQRLRRINRKLEQSYLYQLAG